MRIHNRSPTERNELHKDKQCKHTFEITAARCAPCGGYNVECKHYEETMLLIQSIVPGETIGSPARRSGAAFYVARGVLLAQGHRERGRTPPAPA